MYAMELKAEMDREGLTQAELARKHGISRARVNQWMSLLRLPESEKRRFLAMGDNWDRKIFTERHLRRTILKREFQDMRLNLCRLNDDNAD